MVHQTDWAQPVEVDGKRTTLKDFLKDQYRYRSDAEISRIFRRNGFETTASAVEHQRRHNGWMKPAGVARMAEKDDFRPADEIVLKRVDVPLGEEGRQTTRPRGAEAEAPEPGSAKFHVEGNIATAQATGLVHTLPELIEATNADMDVWKVLRWEAKPYAGWAKKERAHITWLGGAIDSGYVKKDGIEVVQLWSMHAIFVRRKPVPVFPVVQPIQCDVQYASPTPPDPTGVARSVILADPHFWFRREGRDLVPLHDPRALDIVLQIVDMVQPDRVDVLGDLLDMSDWTDRFTHNPNYSRQLQPTLLAAHGWLRAIRERVPHAEIRLFEGNHEKRMRTAITKHLPAALGIRSVDEIELDLPPSLSVQRLLALYKLQIEWVPDYPDGEAPLNDRIWLSHGESVSSVPGGTARKMMDGATVTRVFGHVHRRELTAQTYWVPHRYEVESVCIGCLCHLDGRVEGSRKKQNWQQGLAVIEYEPVGQGDYDIDLIRINYETGTALWNGQTFVGKEGPMFQWEPEEQKDAAD